MQKHLIRSNQRLITFMCTTMTLIQQRYMAPAMWLFSPGTFRAKPLCDKWQIELWEQHRWLEGERYDDDLWAKSWWVDTSYVQDACFMTPRVPAKANIKQWNGEQWPGRSHQSRVTTRTLSLSLSPPSLSSVHPFFHPMNPEQHHTMPFSRVYSRPCGWC